jgi:hypothetical protein
MQVSTRILRVLFAGTILWCTQLSAITIVQADNFINVVYTDLLNRPADAGAYAAFATPLVNGTLTTMQMAGSVLGAAEYRADLIGSYYSSYLNRVPQGTELPGGLSYLGGGGTDQGLQAVILGNLEFFDDQGATNSGFVGSLYTDLLHRPGSPAEQAPFVNALNSSSVTRPQVATIFLGSLEYDNGLVTGYYSQFLRRAPGLSELNSFTTAMQGGETNEQVIAAIIGSQEFLALAQQTPEPGTFEFAGIACCLLIIGAMRRTESR